VSSCRSLGLSFGFPYLLLPDYELIGDRCANTVYGGTGHIVLAVLTLFSLLCWIVLLGGLAAVTVRTATGAATAQNVSCNVLT
jgi:hypothetical protein